MKYLNNVKITTFVKSTDDMAINKMVFETLVPLDFEKEKIAINDIKAEGMVDNNFHILELILTKSSHCKAFLKHLKENFTQMNTLLEQIESRIDEECFFFMRLDKTSLFEGKYVLTEGGDCFHFKMNVACFPKNRENALKVIEQMLVSLNE